MAINLDTLFERLGRVGRLAYVVHTNQAALPAALESFYAEYDGLTPGTGFRDISGPLMTVNAAVIAQPAGWLTQFLPAIAQQTVLATVLADNPAKAQSLELALGEVIRQMVAQSETVKNATVSVVATADALNQGDGVLIVSDYRPDGVVDYLNIAENARVYITADSFGGGATAGNETALFVGEPAGSDRWQYDWPTGSGAVSSIVVASPSSGSLLVNGDFSGEFTTPNLPDNWTATAGTPGTHILKESTTVYGSTNSVEFVGDASTLAGIQQQFDSDAGTEEVPDGLGQYAVAVWVRVDVVPAAGVLTVDLYDGSAVVQDEAGTNNSFTVAATGLVANTWTLASGVFRLPRSVPSTLRLRVRQSTAISSGTSCFVGRVAFVEMSRPNPGCPFAALVSGASPFAKNDGWTVAVANNYGGSSYRATFQWLFERCFGMSGLGLQLPVAGSPTLADTLITAS